MYEGQIAGVDDGVVAVKVVTDESGPVYVSEAGIELDVAPWPLLMVFAAVLDGATEEIDVEDAETEPAACGN